MPPKQGGKQAQYRNICWTLYSLEPPTIAVSIELRTGVTQQVVRYYTYQAEICPDTKRLHWQGYMEFDRKVSMSTIKSAIFSDNTLHIEERRGTQEDAIEYCQRASKRDPLANGYVEWPNKDGRAKMGAKKSLGDIVAAFAGGTPLADVRVQFADQVCRSMQWTNAVFADQQRKSIPDWRFLKVIVYWGAAGAGKTRRVHAMHAKDGIYTLREPGPTEKMWWCGYTNQPVLLLDDFYGTGGVLWGDILRILDGYQLQLGVKGGHAWAAWTLVYITSNVPPRLWYPHEQDMDKRLALYRRLTHVVHMTEMNERMFLDCEE